MLGRMAALLTVLGQGLGDDEAHPLGGLLWTYHCRCLSLNWVGGSYPACADAGSP